MPCAFMPCPLEINNNGEFKQEHKEFFPSTTESIISPLPQCLCTPNVAGGDFLWWVFTHKFTWSFNYVVLRDHKTNENHYIYKTRVAIATKLNRIMIYFKGFLHIKTHDLIITCSWEIMWKTRIILSLLPKYLWPPNLAGWLHTMKNTHKSTYMILPPRSSVSSYDKFNALFLPLHYTSDQETLQGCDLLLGASTHKFT